MREFKCHEISQASGRIRLTLSAWPVGAGLQVMLTGGKAHIGAVALATGQDKARALELAGHREGDLACELAGLLASELDCAVALTCGIHYDAISAAEIATALALTKSLAQELLRSLRQKGS
ncbi:MAG: hypothetical protein HDQ44_02330 [Desulfovibrio sp.]|nr:hypothetical protein [Desulfovibrio sp.]